jgi:hypothetical protein
MVDCVIAPGDVLRHAASPSGEEMTVLALLPLLGPGWMRVQFQNGLIADRHADGHVILRHVDNYEQKPTPPPLYPRPERY